MIRSIQQGMQAGILGLVLVLAACSPAEIAPVAPAGVIPVGDPSAQVARSPRGVVASASVLATEVGARVLAEGGNAVDAAVATAFALAVVEPSMSGLGGRASILIRTPEGEVHGIDGLNQVPSGYREGSGADPRYERAAIPGVPAALGRALEEHGSWPLPRVMDGAIRLAGEGFRLPAAEAGRWAGAAAELRGQPAALGSFLHPDGTPRSPGERVTQPLLARTLRGIAQEGVQLFYRGWIADSIHADMVRNGAFITGEELAAYQALTAIPATGGYRGHHLHSNFRPAAGHAVIQALQTLEAVGELPPTAGEAAWGALVGQAMHGALEDRNQRRGTEPESARLLTSPEHAATRAEGIVRPGSTTAHPDGRGALRESFPQAAAFSPGVLVGAPSDREATTHLSVADADGWVVALTQSLGPSMGTRLVAPGLGFLFATRLGSEPGSRPSSTIAPTLVVRPDGRPLMALGGAGDARIVSAVIQVVSRVLDHGMSLEEAVAAPRIHPDGPLALRLESGPLGSWAPAERERLAASGFTIEDSPSSFFGRVHAVALEEGGVLGVAEPRWNGGAAGPLR